MSAIALNQAQAEQLMTLVADALPTGLEAYSTTTWLLPTLVRSRLADADRATLDGLLTAADPASVPVLVAAGIAVAGVS